MANETIVRDAINYAHDLVVKCGKVDLPHKMGAHNAIDMIEAAYKSELQAHVKNFESTINNLVDENARLVEMQNHDIQVQKTIALEKLLDKQKAINKNLVDDYAELLADLKRSNEQYQHLVNVKSCEMDDNRKPDLITMCERLHRAIKDERTAAFVAQTAYATRREIEDSIVDLVIAIIETRIQKEEKNGCEGK